MQATPLEPEEKDIKACPECWESYDVPAWERLKVLSCDAKREVRSCRKCGFGLALSVETLSEERKADAERRGGKPSLVSRVLHKFIRAIG